MTSCDVVVVGGGIVGCACALAAAQEGLKVRLLEAGRLGAGATAASMGHLVVLDQTPWELALSRWSMRCWRELLDLPGIEYRAAGTLWLAESEAEMAVLHERQRRLAAADWPSDCLDAAALRDAEPGLSHHLVGALRVSQDAIVYPPRVAVELARRARMLGVVVDEGQRVVAVQPGAVTLHDGTRVSARHVLVAAGCDSALLLPGLPLHGRKGHLMITDRYPDSIRHQLVEAGYVAAAHGHADESISVNIQPRATGQLLIGSTRESSVLAAAPSPRLLGRLARRACRFLPALADMQVLRVWTGFRPTCADGVPCIGPWPALRDVWVAAGHEGLGITTAAATARLWLDLLLARPTVIDAAPFSPARWAA
jgi:glycine/D-amino acid oxidase-like deaminating enzyme